MRNVILAVMFFALAGCSALSVKKAETAKTPVEKYGQLKIAKDKRTGYMQLSDKKGNPVVLHGMSTSGLHVPTGQWILNDQAFADLAAKWKIDIVRLAMYIHYEEIPEDEQSNPVYEITPENEKDFFLNEKGEIKLGGGYARKPAEALALVEKGIDLAVKNGLYVMVDWHILENWQTGIGGDPHLPVYIEAGKDLPQFAEIRAAHPEYNGPQLFFAYLAKKYGHLPNMVWEIANEPSSLAKKPGNEGLTPEEIWLKELLPYHESVVKAIRDAGSDHIIIVGTDSWSQHVHAPVGTIAGFSPVKYKGKKDNNIMYAAHIYASTHDMNDEDGNEVTYLRDNITAALNAGLPVFISEWGVTTSTGDGIIVPEGIDRWVTFYDKHNLSHIGWHLSRKKEASSAFKNDAPDFGWTDEEMTESGLRLRAIMLKYK